MATFEINVYQILIKRDFDWGWLGKIHRQVEQSEEYRMGNITLFQAGLSFQIVAHTEGAELWCMLNLPEDLVVRRD